MPKATIVSEVGGGTYDVKLVHDITRAETRITALTDQQDTIQDEIDDLEDQQSDAEDLVATKQQTLNTSINTLNGLDDPDDFTAFLPIVQANTIALQVAITALTIIISKLGTATLTQTSFKKEIKILQNAVDEFKDPTTVRIKGVSFEEGRSGDVDVLYLNDEPSDLAARIAPSAHTVNSAVRQPIESSGSSAITYNLSVMPGYQKWAPDYKSGIISNINTSLNTATVTMFDNISSIRGYNGTTYNTKPAQPVFNNVPVVYLDTHAIAFTDGDSVAVSFSGDLNTPVIIGFTTNPSQSTIPTDISWWSISNELNFVVINTPERHTQYRIFASVNVDHDIVTNPSDYSFIVNGDVCTFGNNGIGTWNNGLNPLGERTGVTLFDTASQPSGQKSVAFEWQIPGQANIDSPQLSNPIQAKKMGADLDSVCVKWLAFAPLSVGTSDIINISFAETGAIFNDFVITGTNPNHSVTTVTNLVALCP